MSRITDYSKFDNIGDDDSSSEDGGGLSTTITSIGPTSLATTVENAPPVNATSTSTAAAAAAISASSNSCGAGTGPSMRKNPNSNRFIYEFNGRAIYEWEQTLEEVILYIPAPPVRSAKDLHCSIKPHHLQVGLKEIVQKDGTMFLDEDTCGTVDEGSSTWTLEDGKTLVIYLIKANPGQVWDVALKGRQEVEMNPAAKQEVQKELMLERFQNENPGFDFRGAEFNGSVPDPRTFMGGVNYQ